MAQFVLSAGVTLDLFVHHRRKDEKNEQCAMSNEQLTDADKLVDENDDKAESDILMENDNKEETKSAEPEEQPQITSSNSLVVADMDETTKAAYQELIDHLETTTGAKVVSFSDILFAPNTDQMLEGSEAVLDEVVRLLEENELMRINICGYTNNVGNKKMEMKTSKKRVNKVVNYLVLHGVDVFRLEVAAYGGENVKAAGINKANRRVEIRVLEDKE
jgi:outer membrane protein OmpA-like peptidoglycan-associated protein